MKVIERKAALAALDRALDDRTWSMSDNDVICQMIEYLEKVPAMEVERTNAIWVPCGFDDGLKCSACGYIVTDTEDLERNPEFHKYCGHCGAKMIKE